MEINWSIVGWITAIIVLYLIGYYEGRSTGYKRRKREEEQEKLQNPPKPVTVDDPGILRIKNEDGNLTLDLDGARLDTSALSPAHRNRLVELLTLMRPWLKDESMPAKATQTSSLPSQPTPFDQTQGRPVSVPPAPPPLRPVPPVQPTALTGSSATKDRPTTPANSIVGQIDSILQAHIVGTPLEERGVFLAQSPQGGVMVYIGLNKYAGIDEVPDEEIKSAIRAAIAEWEKKYTPGL